MTSKFNYIKKGVKYIIGAVVLTISLNTTAFGLNQDNDGYYQIGNKAALKEFARKVNSGKEPNAKGKLMNDIVFNGGGVIENVKLKFGSSAASKVKENRKLKEGYFEEWTPIGTKNNPFEGELISCDGETKKITGLYINRNNKYQGLCGVVEGKVRDIEVNCSYINGDCYVGGIAGKNIGEIENCITTNNIIKGEMAVGGVVGKNSGTISGRCNNAGKVTGKAYYVGGNIGENRGTMEEKCENSGKVIGVDNVGGNVGRNYRTIKGECENSGKVIGEECVGGNVGVNEETILGRCKNSEEVTRIMDVGGNVGKNEGTIGGEEDNNVELTDDNGELIIQGECENSGKVKGIDYVGGNIGHISNNGYLRHAKNSGKVEGNNNIGGNVGQNDGIIRKYANVTDYCLKNEWIVAGIKNVGGNIGINNNEQIAGTFRNNGDIIGEKRVGNNIGRSTTKVSADCYMEGTVNGNKVNYPLGE